MISSHLRALGRSLLALGIVLLLATGCAAPKPATPNPGRPVDVYLIPLEDFSFDFTADLAQSLGRELGLRIVPTVPMGLASVTPFPGTSQFSGEDIMDLALLATPNFPTQRTNTAYVVLTQHDLNMQNRALHFVFSAHNRQHRIAIVSSARLALGIAGGRATDETIRARVRKMVKRSIGDVFFGYPRSTNIRDLMYSPIMSLTDVDRMGDDFLPQNATPEPAAAGAMVTP